MNARSGSLMVLICENISSKTLNADGIAPDMQIIPIEPNLRTEMWLLLPMYRRPHQNPTSFTESLQSAIDFFSTTYGNILPLGDFNMDVKEAAIRSIVDETWLAILMWSGSASFG